MKKFASTLIAILLTSCPTQPQEAAMKDDIAASLDAFAGGKIYATINPTILRSIKDSEVKKAIIDYVTTKLDGQYEQEKKILEELPPGVRAA